MHYYVIVLQYNDYLRIAVSWYYCILGHVSHVVLHLDVPSDFDPLPTHIPPKDVCHPFHKFWAECQMCLATSGILFKGPISISIMGNISVVIIFFSLFHLNAFPFIKGKSINFFLSKPLYTQRFHPHKTVGEITN